MRRAASSWTGLKVDFDEIDAALDFGSAAPRVDGPSPSREDDRPSG
jgi:hypothetical protein